MKKLSLFILKSFLGPFIATFFVAIFLLLMQFLWKWIDELVGKGLAFDEIATLMFYAAVRFVPLALPISMLLASIMTYGSLGEKSELIAMRSAGMSQWSIIRSLLLFIIVLSFGSYFFSNNVMPIANLKSASLLYSIQKQKPAINIKEGIFYNGIEGFSIKVEEKSSDGKSLKDIMIYHHKGGSNLDNITLAKAGTMQLTENDNYLEIKLFDGYSYMEAKDKIGEHKFPFRTTKFKEELIRFDLSAFNFKQTNSDIYKGHYAMLNNNQLSQVIDSLQISYLEQQRKISENIKIKYHENQTNNAERTKYFNSTSSDKNRIYDYAITSLRALKSIVNSNHTDLEYRELILRKHKIEWHRKIVMAVACIILFLIGASLGTIIQKGGFGLPVIISVFFFVLYHVLSMIGEKAAKEATLSVTSGMWLANFVFIPISILLLVFTSFGINKWKWIKIPNKS